jgi:TonB family protein
VTPLVLLAKSVAILSLGAVIAAAMRRQSAACRYVVWLVSLSAILLAPAGILLPVPAVEFTMASASGVTQTASSSSSYVFDWTKVGLAGSALLLIRLLTRGNAIRRVIAGSREYRCDAAYEVRTAPSLSTPVAWGLGRKLILLPESALDWDNNRLRVVLMHESGHLRRNDCWALLLAEIACVVYWCNPLVWFAARQMQREQEHAADDDVIGKGIPSEEYAEHLVAIAREGRTLALAAGAAQRSDLSVRVNAILDPRRVRTMATRRMLMLGIVALFTITLPLASMQAGRKIYKITDDGVIAPKLVEKVEPNYTDAAKDAKIEGTVVVMVVIEVDGKIHEAEVIHGIDEGLDANAVAAVQSWRFEAARKDGEPVPVAAKIEVNFRLL